MAAVTSMSAAAWLAASAAVLPRGETAEDKGKEAALIRLLLSLAALESSTRACLRFDSSDIAGSGACDDVTREVSGFESDGMRREG